MVYIFKFDVVEVI